MAEKTTAKPLDNLTLSVFCENMAMMLEAGITADEVTELLCEDTEKNDLHDASMAVQQHLLAGESLTDAIAESGYFPSYVRRMIATGEAAGRTAEVLHSLSVYYESRSRLEQRIKSAAVYPLILLSLMAGILAVLLAKVLPVFSGVYENLAGGVAASSYRYIQLSYLVGWVALVITAVFALGTLVGVLMGRSPAGRTALTVLAVRWPVTAGSMRLLALSRFTQVLSIFMASGADTDSSLEAATDLVGHPGLHKQLVAVYAQMQNGDSLAKSLCAQKVFEPLYGRMLLAGARSGNTEQVMAKLAALYAEDAEDRIDALVDAIEPTLSAFLTVAIGVTLVSAMLPLVGMLGAIG